MTDPNLPELNEASSAAASDRRAWVRFVCDLEASCQPAGTMKDAGWPAKVRDVSAGGVGLLLKHRFKPGTTLDVELRDGAGPVECSLRARVGHATSVFVEGDQYWLTGCVLETSLSEGELAALLRS